MNRFCSLIALLTAAALMGYGQPAPGVSLVVSEEAVPAGGVAQIKVSLTEPKPIVRASFMESFDGSYFSGFLGIAAAEGLTGIAQYKDGTLRLELGGVLRPPPAKDYPLLTVAVRTRDTLAPGQSTRVVLDLGRSFWLAPGGLPYTEEAKPGSVTTAGTFFVSNVLPGGGTIPAGGRFRVLGEGFLPALKVRAEGATLVSVSPTEFVMEAKQRIRLDGLRITAEIGKERQVYYSYLRGVKTAASTHPALHQMTPVFSPLAAHSALAALRVEPGFVNAIGLQNPTAQPVRLQLIAVSLFGGELLQAAVTLAPGQVLFQTPEELLGAPLPVGSASILVTASGAFQIAAAHVSLDGSEITIPPVITLQPASY